MISAKIIADGKNEFGNRITTMVLTFPRYILAELNTHRMFSRNSASSRAIPFKKMLKVVEENPFIPIAWQKDHSGMQGKEYITDEKHIKQCKEDWLFARDYAIDYARRLNNNEVTKQLCNRLLEPFMWHTVIVTATEFENFFYQRCPQYKLYSDDGHKFFRSKKDAIKEIPDLLDTGIYAKELREIDWLNLNEGGADIHMMALAEAMWDAYNESTPNELRRYSF